MGWLDITVRTLLHQDKTRKADENGDAVVSKRELIQASQSYPEVLGDPST